MEHPASSSSPRDAPPSIPCLSSNLSTTSNITNNSSSPTPVSPCPCLHSQILKFSHEGLLLFFLEAFSAGPSHWKSRLCAVSRLSPLWR
ncbi:hypothetical protein GOP47_0014517 [Adiantum capillus-veneris]|uniref:Uncharacterized protein n=1 Tax=Adiantum capillus-veneris TaxID=13818 RepID=A0A9D4ULN1_ADICA|nr:hypothetical protein GOP47_0014517 [Adiantum capillus-veneris]